MRLKEFNEYYFRNKLKFRIGILLVFFLVAKLSETLFLAIFTIVLILAIMLIAYALLIIVKKKVS